MIMIIKMIEIYTAQPYYCWRSYAYTIIPHAPLTYFRLKEDTSLPSYVQPVMQQYERINNCLTFVIKVATMDDFHNKWKPSRAYHKIDTFRGEQR